MLPVPPPLPSSEPAWRTYVRAGVFLAPAFVSWVFASLFLQARLEMIWDQAGLVGSRAQWLMSSSDFFHQHFWLVFGLMVIVLAVLEFRVRTWHRYRRKVVFSVTMILNSAVLIGLLVICTSALLAVPLLNKAH